MSICRYDDVDLLGQYVSHDPPVDVGQTEVSTLVLEGQLRMVDAQHVQHRRVQVVNMHRVASNVIAEVVGFPIGDTWLDATTRHPDRKRPRVMIPTVGFLGEDALAIHATAKLAAPDDQSIVEHAALLQVLHECRLCLVDILGLALDSARQSGVLVPSTMEKLDKSHVALGEPPGQKAVACE